VSGGDDVVSYRPPEAPGSIILTAGPWGAALECLESKSELMHPAAAPSWIRGCWLGGDWRGITQARVESDLRDLVSSGLSFRGRVIDFGWHGYAGELFSPAEPFPDFEGLVRRHCDNDLDVMVWISPWVPVDTDQWSLFANRGWFVSNESGEPLVFPVVGDGTLIGSYLDFSYREVAQEWALAISRLCGMGVRGFKLDFGEALPADAQLREPVDLEGLSCRSRNMFPLVMQRATIAGLPGDEAVICRSGWTGSEGVVAAWVGDQSSDLSRFSGLGSALWGLQSLRASGQTMIGCDIGGYFGSPDRDTFVAWQKTARMFDFSMYHGLGERAPWRRGEMAREAHQQLANFLARDHGGVGEVTVGWSTNDRVLAQCSWDDSLTVADIGVDEVDVALPDGLWRDVASTERHRGGQTVRCSPGSLFERE
jgi:alpha-glucosidase (family GH31 glycosyl hydrolase)